jgi:RNA polymerase sigma factor (sigma-70 family)
MPEFTSELFEKYAHKVYALCRKYTNDIPTAKDYLQECFLVIYEKYHLYDESKGSPDAWIYKVSLHVIYRLLKKNKSIPLDKTQFNIPEINDENETGDTYPDDYLLNKLNELPIGYQEVFKLAVLENYSHKEISQKLNISESTSRSQLTRAKIYLRNLIQGHGKK